jgi:hypothetical protein
MRDLLFKDFTSPDRKKKIIVTTDIAEKSGVRTKIIRHLICLVKEVNPGHPIEQPLPYLYILKDRNSKEQTERFLCRIKGSVYTMTSGRLYLITFAHSLNIKLNTLTQTKVEKKI